MCIVLHCRMWFFSHLKQSKAPSTTVVMFLAPFCNGLVLAGHNFRGALLPFTLTSKSEAHSRIWSGIQILKCTSYGHRRHFNVHWASSVNCANSGIHSVHNFSRMHFSAHSVVQCKNDILITRLGVGLPYNSVH